MKPPTKIPSFVLILAVVGALLLWTGDANAAIDNRGIMDKISDKFLASASSWASLIEAAATRLFWTLALISMVWTFGTMALRRADIGEFFAEFVRFLIFTGFFWWLLENGPDFARSIIESLMQLGRDAALIGGYGYSGGNRFTPGTIVNIGFKILGKTLAEGSFWSPVASAVGILLGLIILGFTAMIAVNMLLLVISGWILSYAGIFFLGFGGARWTSDMAINYYKAVLGIAIELMTMVLLIGVGVSMINEFYVQMDNEHDLSQMAVIAVVIFTVLLLSNKLPRLMSGVLTGASVGGGGIGGFGAGAAMGAAMTATGMAAAGAGMVGGAMLSGAAGLAGAASAIKAAYENAQDDLSNDDMAGFDNDNSDWYGDDDNASASENNADGDTDAQSGTQSDGGGDANDGATSDSQSDGSGTSGGTTSDTQSNGGDASGGAEDTSGTAESSGAQSSGLLGAAAQMGQVAAGTAGALAKGAGAVAKAKAGEVKQAAMNRIANTTGGKIASAIRAQGGDAKSWQDIREVDAEAEIAAFRDRKPR